MVYCILFAVSPVSHSDQSHENPEVHVKRGQLALVQPSVARREHRFRQPQVVPAQMLNNNNNSNSDNNNGTVNNNHEMDRF